MDKLILGGALSSVLVLSVFMVLIPQADSYLAVPPTRAISNITASDGTNVSAIFSQDNIFITGLVEFFPANKTIKVLGDGQANLTELIGLLNITQFIEGDQININPINITHSEILLEPCLDDQFLVYVNASNEWVCTDLSTINGTGGGANFTHVNLEGTAFVFKNETGNNVFFRGLTAAGGITITERPNDILIQTGGGGPSPPKGANNTNAYFNAEEATIDDLTGVDCVNDITLSFFDNTAPNQYRRQAIEFCPNADTDDNFSWLYVVPAQYEDPEDLEFRLFWTDDNGDGGTVISQINADADDAEEGSPNNPTDAFKVRIGSSDLELHNETFTDVPPDFNDLVGMRFTNITIPQGATITNATIQFTVDSTNPDLPLNVVFDGHDIDNSPLFINCGSCGNISGRVGTTASVNWSIPHWPSSGVRGPDQVTPSLAPIVQEIIDRTGWASGNALTIMIRDWINPDPDGERHADSFDGSPSNAPEISISFQTAAGGETPVCFEISLLPLKGDEFLDGTFSARQTVCTNRNGIDQLTVTSFTVLETAHEFEKGDLVMIRLHRPNDFVMDDFESDVFVLGGELKYIN